MKDERKIVAIAAGHYPSAPGACYNGLIEHAEACVVAAHLGVALEGLGIRAVTVTGTLRQKIQMIADCKLQIEAAVEIHFNASANATANGTEVLFGSDARDRGLAEAIQKRLVAALGLCNRGVKFVEYQGKILAQSREDEEKEKITECFWTKALNCPAVIVEPLFISNPGEAGMLKGIRDEGEGRREEGGGGMHGVIAGAVAEGIGDFINAECGMRNQPS